MTSSPPAALAAALAAAASGDITPLEDLAASHPDALATLASVVNKQARSLGYDRAEIRCPAGHPACAATEAVLRGQEAAATVAPPLRAEVATALAGLFREQAADLPGMDGWPEPLRHQHTTEDNGVFTLTCPLCWETGLSVLLGCRGCLQAAITDALSHVLSRHTDPAAFAKLKDSIRAQMN